MVMGTGNHDEDGYLGYFCKAGDGVVDVQLIADLHKSEVFKVGAVLGVPQSILSSPPSADLWEGQTDEDELGVTYDFVELYTGWFLKQSKEEQASFVEKMDKETLEEWEHLSSICEQVHRRNAHKLTGAVNLNVLLLVCWQIERVQWLDTYLISSNKHCATRQSLLLIGKNDNEDNHDHNESDDSVQLQLLLQHLTLQLLRIRTEQLRSTSSTNSTSAVSASASVLSTMMSSFSPRSMILSANQSSEAIVPILSIITPFTASSFCCTRVVVSVFGSFHLV